MPFALSDMQVTSSTFSSGGPIPTKHTGEGEDVSPALAWSAAPPEAKAFAIICHDPDAPLVKDGTYGYVHWVLYNLPASTTSLEEATTLGTAGRNDSGNDQYNGPMPPPGHGEHRYYFWVIALDDDRTFEPGLTMWQWLAQAEPNIIAMNRITGTYQRG